MKLIDPETNKEYEFEETHFVSSLNGDYQRGTLKPVDSWLKPVDSWPKAIELTNGKLVHIDPEDYKSLVKYTWIENEAGYAVRYYYDEKEKHKVVRMHRQILGYPGKGMDVDHINGNKLDNRKANLRACSRVQNSWNAVGKPGSSQYKGVDWDKEWGKWRVKYKQGDKFVTVCRLRNEFLAAIMADAYMYKERGEYHKFNIPELKPIFDKYLKAWRELQDE